MKPQKSKTRSSRVVFSLVCVILLLCNLLPLFSGGADAAYDYSRPGYSQDIYNNIYTAPELLEDALSFILTDAERNYLSEYSNFKIVYPKTIPASYISIVQNGADVTLAARAYSYNLSDGTELVCLPKSAQISGALSSRVQFPSVPEPDGTYTVSFDGVAGSDSVFDVDYYISVKIAKDDVNSLISKAYLDARYFDYLEKLSVYESELSAYNAYLNEKKLYDEACREYSDYLGELADYEAAMLIYNEYQSEMELYKEAYIKWETENSEYAAYEEYAAQMEKINYRLSLMNDLKLNMTSLNRSLYDAIMGSAVDEVLENKNLLSGNVIGANPDAIDKADEATRRLRSMFNTYFKQSDDESRYIFYCLFYPSLTESVSDLFASLDNLYSNKNVREIVATKGKADKFEILMAQLYYASHAFQDGPVYKFGTQIPYDSSYTIPGENGVKTPLEVLGTSEYYTDMDIAAPAKNEVYPEPVEKPNYTPAPKPQEPVFVAKPTAPIAKPEPSTAPTQVAVPIAPSTVPKRDVSVFPPFEDGSAPSELLEAYRDGKLAPRDEFAGDFLELELTLSMNKSLNPEQVTVTYFKDGTEMNVVVDAGTLAEIDYVPEKAETEKASYVFEAWVDGEGNPVDLSCVTQDIIIYPSFREVAKTVDITWLIDGIPYVTKVPYDELPTPPIQPVKQGDINTYYVLKGWDKPLSTVSAPVCYTAVFEKRYVVPELAFDGALTLNEDIVTVNAGSVSELDISVLIPLAKGKYSVVFNLANASLGVSYSELIKLSELGAAKICFEITKDAEPTARVEIKDSSGAPIVAPVKLLAELFIGETKDSYRLFTAVNGEKTYIRFTASDGKISFSLNTGTAYYLKSEYAISFFSKEGLTLSSDNTSASMGAHISVNCSIPEGAELVTFYYVGADGVRVDFGKDGFTMPDFSVTVGADFKAKMYQIVFISDGVVISSKSYKPGDEVKVPEDPWKENDAEYSYEFIGWSPEITAAGQDAEYTALFRAVPLPPRDGGLGISEDVLRLIVTGGLGGAILLLGVIPSAASALILLVKRKRKK